MIKQRIDNLYNRYLTFNSSRFLRKKINNYLKKNKSKSLSNENELAIRTYYSKFGFKKLNVGWHQYYIDKNNLFSPKYIPEDIFYNLIEPQLNKKSFGRAFTDKNYLNVFLPSVKQPKIILKNINGSYYKNDRFISKNEAIEACSKIESFVIKPSIDSGGGKKVELIHTSEPEFNEINKIDKLLSSYKKDFVIQEPIEPNKHLQLLNESSVNSIRVMSLLTEKETIILSSVIRIGSQGQFTDNTTIGGISVGIKSDGTLMDCGYDTNGKKYTSTGNQYKFSGFSIPSFNTILEKTKELHKLLPHFNLVSWDFTLNKDEEIVLIEINLIFQEINFHQLHNGPLFGEHTEEILSMIKK